MHSTLTTETTNARVSSHAAAVASRRKAARPRARNASCVGRRVSVRVEGSGLRVRWYRGTVCDVAVALQEYTVRFDDGEVATLDLRSLFAQGDCVFL